MTKALHGTTATVLGGGLSLMLLALGPVAGQDAQDTPAELPAVEVLQVGMKDVTPTADFVGRVEAVQRVDLQARVTGFLDEQRFADGQQVQAGDILFVIEQEPFAAEVQQARANVDAAKAEFENASVQLQRAEQLVQNNNIPQATVDERRAAALTAEAAIAQAEASLRQAEITYDYTEIKTPIVGRIGRANAKVGNLVGPETGILATVVQEDPVYVTFTVAERALLEFRRSQAAVPQAGAENGFKLRLRLGDDQLYEEDGELDFADVQVSATTDTVTLRGTFPNPTGLLIDNQFVEVIVFSNEPVTALMVPMSTVQIDQRGQFVLTVDAEDKVEVRRITTGDQIGREVMVSTGLDEGDRIIVDGLMKVRPGMQVQAVLAEPAGA
ncbi:MAG: efflux RND transporter periplasmic adaptor subunit [Pseudomonadota bacterium]